MPKVLMLAMAGFLSGCAFSYEECHESPLLAIYAKEEGRGLREIRSQAPLFEDSIVFMADDFGVPLHEVIPVRVYIDGDRPSAKSYYNPLTRSIVLRGSSDPRTFAHELSHLLANRILRVPPYWADQALAEYMEERYSGARRSNVRGRGGDSPAERTRFLIRRIAEARDPSELLAHITPQAVDEARSWGSIVALYLFESRWAGRATPEKIRSFLRLTQDDVAAYAPEILGYCRRPGLLAGGGPSLRAGEP